MINSTITIFLINSLVIILLLLYVVYELYKFLRTIKQTSLKTYILIFSIVHFSISLIFAFFFDKFNTTDPVKFYVNALEENNWFNLFYIGNSFMSFLIFPFVKLGISFKVLFLLFSVISFKGFLEYFKIIGTEHLEQNTSYILLFLLLPSIHLWAGFLGKEPILFLSMIVLLKKIKYSKYDWGFLGLGLLIFMIRPHLFFVLVFSLVLSIITNKNIPKITKRILVFGSIITSIVFIPIFLRFFLRLEDISFNSMLGYLDDFLILTQNLGNASISISDTTIFTRIFFLIFMPLPLLYNINNEIQLIASMENILFLIIFIIALINYLKNGSKFKALVIDQKFTLIASITLIVFFGSYLYNLGMGNRMRIMFLPYLFYFFINTINLKNIKSKQVKI